MRVENQINIDAEPGLVWQVTREIERWPEWGPTVTSLERLDIGPFALGSVARIKQPMQPEAVWVVTELTEGERFAWVSHRRGLRFKGIHEVHPDGGGTRSLLAVEVGGIFALLLWPMLRVAITRALAAENEALKHRCEGLQQR